MMIPTLAILALTLWLLVAEPLLGKRSFRQLVAALDAGQPNVRLRFYRSWIWQGWALVAITLLIAFGLCHWTPAQLGWSAPHDSLGISADFLLGFIPTLLIGAVFGVVLMRKSRRTRRPVIAGSQAVLHMLPRTHRERWAFAVLAVTAGIGEEVVWRGFGIAALLHFLPHASTLVLVLALAIPFGWAHFYQGLTGMLATAVIGGLMAWIYLTTGSLLLPIVLHTLIDLRALLIPVAADNAKHSAAPSVAGEEQD